MTEKEINDFVRSSQELLKQRQANLQTKYQLDTFDRFDWNQQECQLVFSKNNVPSIIADIQFVGSYSRITNTWLWSWANPHFEANIKQSMLELKEFGEQNSVAKLITPKWEADEIDGWEMTSIAVNFFHAVGAYRTEEDNGFTYMILNSVRKVN